MRIAVIDVGGSSIHMVIAETESDGRPGVLGRARNRVHLGPRTLLLEVRLPFRITPRVSARSGQAPALPLRAAAC